MKDADRQFLASLGFDEGRGGAWRLLLRKGNVLLVLPDSPDQVRIGLGLYRPQKAIAAMMVRVIRLMPFGLRFLPRWQGELRKGGPAREVLDEMDGSLTAVLLGNPRQAERRAVFLIENEKGRHSVAKVGTSPAAVAKIRCEISFLEANAGLARMIPKIEAVSSGEGWLAFVIAYQNQRRDLSHAEICDLFRGWIAGGKASSLDDFEEWEDLKSLIESNEADGRGVNGWDQLQLKKSIRHGDFAPWNILGSERDGEAVVIDWEFGRVDSFPGLDLVHYLYIPAILVGGMEPLRALDYVREVLQDDAGFRELLKEWGWNEKVDLLLKTYFYSMRGELENFKEMARAV